MARQMNYDSKIEMLQAKIDKKRQEIKALKAEIDELQSKKSKDQQRELIDYMQTNNITASEILAKLKA